METQLYLTIQEWSLGSNIVMDFGLIASPLGLNMPLSILPDLPHPTMVSTGIHHFQKGPIIYMCKICWIVTPSVKKYIAFEISVLKGTLMYATY